MRGFASGLRTVGQRDERSMFGEMILSWKKAREETVERHPTHEGA